MAVIFEHKEGWFRPRFICDACQQPITDVRVAMVAYTEPGDNAPELTRVFHSHKDDVCQIATRRMAAHSSPLGMWDELANHIVMLATDVGLFPTEFAEQYQSLSQRGLVPPLPGDAE